MPPGGEAAFLASLPVRTLPGVGPKAEVRLVAAGVATIGALAELDDDRLAELLPGARRRRASRCARAASIPRPVSGEPAEAISISNEETFDVDVRDREELYDHLRRMAEGLAAALERRGMSARTVTTKVRYPDFAIATRSHSMRGRHRRRRGDRPTWRAACSTARYATGPDRSAWWAWGCRGSTVHRQLSLPVAEDEPATP